MPYFVYRIHPFGRLEKVAAPASFAEASALAKSLRTDGTLPDGCSVKVMFAEDEWTAEELLSQVRERPPGLAGDE
jgi:hypothetical protein